MWLYAREDLKFLAVNKAAIRKYGFSRKEFMQMTLRDIIPAEDIASFEEAIHQSKARNSLNDQYVARHRKKSGQVFYIHITSQQTSFNGQPARYVVALDIDKEYKTDQQARALNQQLQDILQNMEDGFFALDRNWRYILSNPGCEKFLGLKPEQLLNKPLQEASPEFNQSPYDEHLRAVMHKGIPSQLETHYNNEGNWMQLRLYPFNEGICGFFSDITQRKKNEEKLRLALERYEIVSKATNEIIWEWDLANHKIIWNRGIYKNMKYHPGEVDETIKWWQEKVHPEDYHSTISTLQQAIAEGKTHWEAKYRFLCRDGEYRYFHDRAYLIYNEKGEPVRVIGTMQDIHQQRLYQEEINKLSLVARKTRNGVVITDKDGFTEWINDGFTRITGYTLEEIAGKKPGHILQGPLTNPDTVRHIQEKLRQQIDFSSEIINYHKNGQPIWVRMDISPIFEEAKLVKFIGITTEITERKHFEERLKQQNEQLKEIAWISSHDVRRPVASILGLISLYDKEMPFQEFNHEILTHLSTCALELDQVIRKIVFKTYEVSSLQEEGTAPDNSFTK